MQISSTAVSNAIYAHLVHTQVLQAKVNAFFVHQATFVQLHEWRLYLVLQVEQPVKQNVQTNKLY